MSRVSMKYYPCPYLFYRVEEDPVLISDNKLGFFDRIYALFRYLVPVFLIGKTSTMDVLLFLV